MLEEEKLQEIAKRNPFSRLIGMELSEVREGYAKGRIALTGERMNIYGGMHGGCAYALADTLAGIAASTYGNYVTTVSGNMNYLLPMKDSAYIYCEAKVVRQGGTVGVYETEITNDEGKVLATACFTYYRLPEKIK